MVVKKDLNTSNTSREDIYSSEVEEFLIFGFQICKIFMVYLEVMNGH